MILRTALFIFFVFQVLPLTATHIVGGHLEVKQTDSNQYDLKLVILRDCGPGNSQLRNFYSIRIFRLSDTSFTTHTFPLNPPTRIDIGDSCFSPPSLCLEQYIASGSILLPYDSLGYLFVAQEFARNFQITNIFAGATGPAGMTWVTEFPGKAVVHQNSTPELKPLSGNTFLCLNTLRELDFSATDPDGDSLAYHLEVPFNSPAGTNNNNNQPLPGPPPYSPVSWKPGYSLSTVITGNPPLSIDPITGILSVKPDMFGIYVVVYAVSEFRNGVKIGEVRRDLQFEVLNCTVNEKPEFVEPKEESFTSEVGSEFCVSVLLKDRNPTDTLFLKSEYQVQHETDLPPNLRLINGSDTGSIGGQICWTPTCEEVFARQKLMVNLSAISQGCDATDSIFKTIEVDIRPIPATIENLFPNIFTPNGDGINDVFTLPQPEDIFPCLSNLNIRIFNRWGVEVYQNKIDNSFGWDGTLNGNDVPEGVYFYVVSAEYGNIAIELKHFLTLSR